MERARHYQTATRDSLTPRQREVLDLIARGKTNGEIAEHLGITLDGAKFHVREILAKLGVESREEAAAWWRKENRWPKRVWRGLAWLAPGLGVATGAAGVLALAAIVTVAGLRVAEMRGGGHPAAAYVPVCAEGDVSVQIASELSGEDNVRVRVELTRTGASCYLGGTLTVGSRDFDPNRSYIIPASIPLDTILPGTAAASFDIPGWCDSMRGTALDARTPVGMASSVLDFPGSPCASGPLGLAKFSQTITIMRSTFATVDDLPRCNPELLRPAVDVSASLPYDATAPAARAVPARIAFGLSWQQPVRPVSCEFKSAAGVLLVDGGGQPLDVEGNDANAGFLVRFRRTTLPIGSDGKRQPRNIHVPGTGGTGSASTEATILSSSEGSLWMWENWCGADRSPVTVTFTTAAGRVSGMIERPPCADPSLPSRLLANFN